MPTYLYKGEVRTAIALPTEEGQTAQTVDLIPGESVELPDTMPYVQRMVAKGILLLVEAPKAKRTKAQEAES